MAKLVCFDVGGVLIRITQIWREAAQFANVEILADIDENAMLMDALCFDQYQQGDLSDHDYLLQLSSYLGHIGVAKSLAVHNHIMIEPFDGVATIVNRLNEQGLSTACLSNTNELHWQDMFHSGRFPANEALQVRHASHLMGLQKPNREIFRRFENLVGFGPSEIFFFDDSKENVLMAQSLGWHAKWIVPEVEPASQIEGALCEFKVWAD